MRFISILAWPPSEIKVNIPRCWQGADCAIRRTSVISPAPMWMLSKVAPIWNILRGCGVDTRRALELLGQLSRANLWASDLVKKQSGHKGYAQCWPLIFTYMCTHMDTSTPHTNAYIHLYTHINTGDGKRALFTKKLGEQKAPSVLFIQSFFIWWKRLSWCFLNSKAYHYDRNTQLWFAKHLKMCKTINLLMGSHISSE